MMTGLGELQRAAAGLLPEPARAHLDGVVAKAQENHPLVISVVALALLSTLPSLVPYLLTQLAGMYRMFEYDCNRQLFFERASKSIKYFGVKWPGSVIPRIHYVLEHESIKKLFPVHPDLAFQPMKNYTVSAIFNIRSYRWLGPHLYEGVRAIDKEVYRSMTLARLPSAVAAFEDQVLICYAALAERVGKKGAVIPLAKTLFTITYAAGSTAIFGPDFDVHCTQLELSILDHYDAHLIIAMTLPILPYWVWNHLLPGARKGHAARQRLADYFLKWRAEGGVNTASEQYRQISGVMDKYDFPADERARWNVQLLFGFQANTGLAVPWFLIYACQTPKFLAALKAEIAALPEGALASVDLKRAAPLLTSAITETLRVVNSSFPARGVVGSKPVHICGVPHPVKPGEVVMAMTRASTYDTAAWGEDAHAWKGQRFLDQDAVQNVIHFGGGVSACPGRHFAILELQLLLIHWFKTFEVDLSTLSMTKKVWYAEPDDIIGALAPFVFFEAVDLDGTVVKIQHPGFNPVKAGIAGLLPTHYEPTIAVRTL